MAQISLHQFLRELRGKVDDVVIRKIRGKYFVSRKPKPRSNYKPSAGQKAHRGRFKAASAWAGAVQRDPKLLAYYAPFAKQRDLRVRAVAIADWFGIPEVNSVDLRRYAGRAGNVITIRATDEFGVTRVAVIILDANHDTVEQGDAVLRGKSWRYTATTTLARKATVTIKIQAYDRAHRAGEWKTAWPAKAAASDK
jgi:hypothetical protein